MNEPVAKIKLLNRDEQLLKIQDEAYQWDLLIIGGGATGIGIGIDAATRGYKTLLVEQADFAKGTSSRSTKLVHGGVRYLAQGNVRLVREASVERGRLYKNAPHLVRNQTFIIPMYTNWNLLKYTFGLKLYDWISGRLSLGSSVSISRKKTLQALPGIERKNLLGGVLYHDGQFDDARLAINLVQTMIENGGCAINYMKLTALKKNENEKIEGAIIVDEETKHEYVVKAKAVVNATGVFVDDILSLDDPAMMKTICVSQGIHLVLDKKFFPSSHALMIPETRDGRVLFAIPWYDKIVLGTTDTPVQKASLEPEAMEEEISFILDTASTYLELKPKRSDVLSVFAGLRPLAAPKEGRQKTKEISRSHKILVSPSNLFTIVGGKWTTYRKMGEDMVNRVEEHLMWPSRKTSTTLLPIHGYQWDGNVNDPFSFYGSDALMIRQNMNGKDNAWISKSLKIHEVQLKWAVQNEMARTVEDFLSRRTRALLLDAKESIRICNEVATIMAELLGKDNQWIEIQVADFTSLANKYVLK